jgi:hypothetical protein
MKKWLESYSEFSFFSEQKRKWQVYDMPRLGLGSGQTKNPPKIQGGPQKI